MPDDRKWPLDHAGSRWYEPRNVRSSTVQTQVNGITLAYNDQGSGLPIVFLHAFPLNRTMWAEQEKAVFVTVSSRDD